jgi:hypothetical protein
MEKRKPRKLPRRCGLTESCRRMSLRPVGLKIHGKEHSYLAAKCPDGDFRLTVPEMLFRNEARTPGRGATTVLKGLSSVPCSPAR